MAMGRPKWVIITPTVDENGTLSYKRSDLISPTDLFEERGTTNNTARSQAIWGAEDDSISGHVLSKGGERKRKAGYADDFRYGEYVIKPDEISAHPGLLDEIKLAMCQHSSSSNNHSDCMVRLNAVAQLSQIVQGHLRAARLSPRRPKKPKKQKDASPPSLQSI